MICEKEYNLQIGCKSTNKKTLVMKYENIILLKSYDTFISLYDINKKLLINNITWYKSSATTRKHFSAFKLHLYRDLNQEFKNECFLNNKYFYELVRLVLFEDLQNVDIKINNILKEYELEVNLIETLVNYEFNLNEDYNCDVCGWKTIKSEFEEFKTRNKEFYTVEIANEFDTIHADIIITTNKKRSKLLGSKVKLISRCGLSYNNYNTKELNYYTGFDIEY